VPTIRIDVASSKPTTADFLAFSIQMLKKIVVATESTGVRFGVENHGKITNNPEFLDALFAGVGSKRVGLTLDTGNFYWFGHPLTKVYEAFVRFAPRVYHTHCKSIKYPADKREQQRPMGWKYAEYNCPLFEGDIDFHRVIKILRDAGYHNDLCLEDESLGKAPQDRRTAIVTREIQCLKDAGK
jgi:sugar phosphate isomerase/epimerase